jgi:hypothetical protein
MSDGRYPSTPLVVAPFGVLAADEFPWSAVLNTGGVSYSTSSPRVGAPLGEISWLAPEEIRFLSAATLAEAHPRTNGRLRIHTRTWSVPLDLEEPVTPDQLMETARALAANTITRLDAQDLAEADTGRRPETIDCDYTAETRRLLDRMDVTDPLLHRGLYKLLMATELSRQYKFLEESGLSALISREAALELLRRKLSAAAGTRWKLDDVLVHIAKTFPTGEPFVEVLRSDWAVRVMMTHPVSEHGEHWTPPVEAEECMDALHTLTYLYRYLLLDEVWEPAEDD